MRDPQGLNMPDKNLSRDPSRTPMQWDSTRNAGFTDADPWLRVDRSYPSVNVNMERDQRQSMISLYKRLIDLREKEPSLTYGEYRPVYSDNQMIAYIREASGAAPFLIVLNLSHRPCHFKSRHSPIKGKVEISTSADLEGTEVNGAISLSGDEGIVVRLSAL